MELNVPLFRVWRILRRTPTRAFHDWWGIFANKGELFSFSLAVFTSYIGLRTASIPQILEEAERWMDAIQAFVYVALGWAFICLIRAPLVIALEERRVGRWYDRRFVYHEPRLVRTIRCKPTGKPQSFQIAFPEAEAGGFVRYRIEAENSPPPALYTAVLANIYLMPSDGTPGRGAQQGGTTLTDRKAADLMVTIKPEALAITFRIYALSFTKGQPDEQDGETGESRMALQRAAQGDDGP